MPHSFASARPDASDRGRHRRVVPFTSRVGFVRLLRLTVAVLTASAVTAGGLLVAPQAVAAPRPTATVSKHPTLSYDSRGAAVKWLQASLSVRPRSGWFGPTTRRAVVRFQKRQGLRANGVVTGPTWRKLGVRYKRPARAARAARAARSAPRSMAAGTPAFGSRVTAVAAATARGARYRYGSTGPKAFDCSGYVGYVYRKATGKKLPRTSGAMRAATRRISKAQARAGDLVFVHSGSRVTHVGIYGGGNTWWEASNPRTYVGRHKAWSTRVSYGRA